MTTLSVCLPVHNGSAYLGAALDSVLDQTTTKFSIVVSDNSSTDATPAIVAGYVDRDERISASRSDRFLAQAESINRALDLGDGEWLKPLCHDDLLERECVARLGEALESLPETVGLVGHAESHLFANGYLHRPATSGDLRIVTGRDLLRGMLDGAAVAQLPSLTTAVVRSSAWALGERFDSRYSHSDVFCWARLLMRCDYAYLDVPLTVNRIHAGQVAVAARATQRTTHEHHEFWNAFVDEFGVELGLSRQAVARARLRGAASAGSAAAIQILKGRPRAALASFRGSPARWWPLLPALTARAYLMERARIRELRTRVPVELIYP